MRPDSRFQRGEALGWQNTGPRPVAGARSVYVGADAHIGPAAQNLTRSAI